MIPGETILSGANPICPDCQTKLEFAVCESAAGYYVGTWCNCGPYSRETCYFRTKEQAEKELKYFNETGFLPNAR